MTLATHGIVGAAAASLVPSHPVIAFVVVAVIVCWCAHSGAVTSGAVLAQENTKSYQRCVDNRSVSGTPYNEAEKACSRVYKKVKQS